MQQTETSLRKLISGFLRHVHAEAGDSIKHISVTVHGQLYHLEDGRYTEQLATCKMPGAKSLYYQSLQVEGPIDNMVTLIATSRRPPGT
ncbi:hypothetical protein [Chitinophaga barathri]|uniref:Uncharacterized protein n=1 Tax=Chitinophaga barathri TaxID=1647451 RepID=A0A3N4M983_9BACT|nr:hypothetical protein [Chitinophaga barathri]RPD40242.1 hypothetical protein EG028_16470 [Chitinophaga barathri]